MYQRQETLRGVELARERGEVVDRDLLRVLAACGAAGEGVEAVRPGGARDGGEPAVADAELAREVVVGGEVGAAVVAHDHVDRGSLRPALGVVGDEAAHPVRDLLGDAGTAVAGILRLRQRSPLQVPDRVLLALVAVRETGRRPSTSVPTRFEAQVAEHVIEGAVLEHQHDDVLDLLEVGDALVLGGGDVALRGPALGRARAGGRRLSTRGWDGSSCQ